MGKLKFKQLGMNRIAGVGIAKKKILDTATKISETTKDMTALEQQRADIESAIVQGTIKDTKDRNPKPTLDEATAQLTGDKRFMKLCRALNITEDRIRELVQEGLKSE